MTPAAIRRQIADGAAKAVAKSREQLALFSKRQKSLDRRVERRLDNQAIGKKPGWAGFCPPTAMEVSTLFTHDQGRHPYCTVAIRGLRLISELNRREHHMVTHSRKKAQQEIVRHAMRESDLWGSIGLPRKVTITRIAPRLIRDGDNEVSCAKHCRDAVAKAMGVDDGDKRITWKVKQRRGERYGVEIRIEPRGR